MRAGGLKCAIDATGARNNGRVGDVREHDEARTKDGEKRQQNKQERPRLAHAPYYAVSSKRIALIASHAAGCRYCQAHTALAAERFGASEARLEALWSYETSDLFTGAEKVTFDLALAGAMQPSAIDDLLIERVRSYWDDGEIVELMGVIALFGFLNRWNDGMGTTLESPAQDAAQRHLANAGWSAGKHEA